MAKRAAFFDKPAKAKKIEDEIAYSDEESEGLQYLKLAYNGFPEPLTIPCGSKSRAIRCRIVMHMARKKLKADKTRDIREGHIGFPNEILWMELERVSVTLDKETETILILKPKGPLGIVLRDPAGNIISPPKIEIIPARFLISALRTTSKNEQTDDEKRQRAAEEKARQQAEADRQDAEDMKLGGIF